MLDERMVSGVKEQTATWISGFALLAALCLTALHGFAQGSPGATNSAEMEREFKAAMAAQDAGDLQRAELLLRKLHDRHPGIFAIDESLGLVYVARGKFAESVPVLEAAVHEQPSSDVAHANLGAAYFKLNRNREALREFQIAAKLNPRNAATQQSLGQLWLEAHKPDLAAAAYAQALKLKPGDWNLLLAQAEALVDAGKTAEAKKLITGWPGAANSATAQSLLGDIEEKSGAYREAAQCYTRAVNLDPSEANVWKLGVEFLRHWTFDAAIREFEAAQKLFPKSARMRLGLGAAYFGDAKYANAIPVFADLLEEHPGNALYAELLGMSCTAVMREARPRCSLLRTYAQSHPRDAKASVYAASGILQGNPPPEQLKTARVMLRNAIAAEPKFAEARFQMGLLEQFEGNWAGSVKDLEEAIALKPDLAAAHYRLGLAYWRAGRKQEAHQQIALQRKYYKQQQRDLDHRLSQITTFLVSNKQ